MHTRQNTLALMILSLLGSTAQASEITQVFNSLLIREDAARFIHDSPITSEEDTIEGRTYKAKKLFVRVPNPVPEGFPEGYAQISVICFPEPANRCDVIGNNSVPEMGVMNVSQNYSFYGEQARNIYNNFYWQKIGDTDREVFGCAPNADCPFNLTFENDATPSLTFNVHTSGSDMKAAKPRLRGK